MAFALTNLILIFLLIGGMLLAVTMGYIKIPVQDVFKIIAFKLTHHNLLLANLDQVFPYVIWDVRLPRIITSCIVGGGLSVAGVIFQNILINPLADPYTLGISAGAAFGASLALIFGIKVLGIYSVTLFAFLGAVLTLLAVIEIASYTGSFSSYALILSGIIVSAILSAGISFMKYIAGEQVAVLIFWLMGSFVGKSWSDAAIASFFVIPGSMLCLFYSRDLNIMSLGDRTALTTGVDVRKMRLLLLTVASLITASCVSVSGIIGFVGLLIPHLMRLIVGSDAMRLIPTSFFAGAFLLMLADNFTRIVLPSEVPIGVITAIIGGPFFCYIFMKRHSMMEKI